MTNRDMSTPLGPLRLDRAGPTPLYLQLRDRIVEQVETGRLAPGSRLPSVRDLARRLRLNVNTVARAYRVLEEDGAVTTHAAKGTFVQSVDATRARAARVIPAVTPEFAPAGETVPPRAEAACLAPGPGTVSLAGGTPAPDLFPMAEIRRLVDLVLDQEGPAALQYGSADGFPGLREAAARLLGVAGIATSPDDLLVTTGAQQALDLVARALLAPGDAVLVEAPTYPGALESVERAGCRVVAVPMTPEGPEPLALAVLVERYRPRLFYTVPTFHNPTGWTATGAAREAALAAAARHGMFVVEDDHAADLRFEGEAWPPLKALDRVDLVIHVRGFAKTVAPGLRLAVVAAPAVLRPRLVALKLAADLYAPPLEQRVLARFLADGYAAHLARIRPAYRARRDAALRALAALAPAGVTVTPPSGGLNVWVGLPEGVSAGALEREARAAGVAVAPGGLFFPDRRDGDRFVRLSYGSVPEPVLAAGLARFAAALDRVQRLPLPAAAPAAMPLV